MAVRASKLALARAAELLGTDRPTAREYLRRIQITLGDRDQVPFGVIVESMEATGTTDEDTVAAHVREARES